MHKHSESGCESCLSFLHSFFPPESLKKKSKSVKREVRQSLEDLFEAMDMSSINIDGCLMLSSSVFVNDFLKVLDEIKTPRDIVNTWQIPYSIACRIYSVIEEIFNNSEENSVSDEEVVDSDVEDDEEGDTEFNESDYSSSNDECDEYEDSDCSNSSSEHIF